MKVQDSKGVIGNIIFLHFSCIAQQGLLFERVYDPGLMGKALIHEFQDPIWQFS